MIRTLVQRIEIGLEVIKIVFRVTQEARGSGPESIVVTLPRMYARIESRQTLLIFG